MPNVEVGELAVGIIFSYPEPVSPNRLSDFLEEKGYTVNEESGQAISLTGEGISVDNTPFAEREDGVSILYNDNADLRGFSESSFITVVAPGDVDKEILIGEVESLCTQYTEFDIGEEKRLVEVTMEGYIEVGRSSNDFSQLFDNQKFQPFESFSDSEPAGKAMRVTSTLDDKEDGWYNLLMDTEKIGNPRRWAYKLMIRHDTYQDIDADNMRQTLSDFIELTEV